MRIGLQINNFTWPGGERALGSTLADVARRADEAGFYSVWVMDHFWQIRGLGPPEEPMLEAYSTLGFLAGITSRVRLGTMVTGVVYRFPGLLIKAVTTLDVLSGGRAYFGVGAAWNEAESRGLGIPFPPLVERFERLEETLQLALQMWSGEESSYHGKHYHFERTLNSPKHISQPHPPILIGGWGEKKTLRMVAQYADACNLFARDDYQDTLSHKLDVLKRHCDDLGRDYDEIEKTSLSRVAFGSGGAAATDVIEKCRNLAAMGFQQAIFSMPRVEESVPLEIFAKEIIPAVSEF